MFSRKIRQLRDTFYFSQFLSSLLWPVYLVCSKCATQIRTKVKRNGAVVDLPGGQTLRFARDVGVAMSSLMFWNGLNGYEPETTGALRPLAERSTTLVDVGANIGLYSMLGALWNPKLSVLAFEPVPAIYRGLLKNIELNGLQQRVKCEQLALANQSGVSTFHLPDSEGLDLETTGSLSPNGWQARKASNKFEVQTVRFDDYELQHPSRIDLIKIDVEDYESEVLMGMERILRRDHPFVICEILNRDHRNERTREFLQAIGYTAYWIIPSVFVRVADFDFQRHYSNFLLSPVATGEILHSPDSLWEKRLSLAS